MNPLDLKLAVASGALEIPAARAEIGSCLLEAAGEFKRFAEALEATAGKLIEGDGESLEAEAALQIATARRALEEAGSELGDLFDVSIWLAGVSVAGPEEGAER